MPSTTATPAPVAKTDRDSGPSNRCSFRVGKVKTYRRGSVWYLCYYEDGRRMRPRVGTSRPEARKLAAQINARLESGAASLLRFQPWQEA